MAAASDVSARTVAELVVQLGCLARGDGFVAELTLAQWAALRYFSRANRFSRTVSAFAEVHGTTRGWSHISVIKALLREGIEPDIVCGTSIGQELHQLVCPF